MKGLLLHVCCAPCAISPVEFLREQQENFTRYFFNPNIHPYQEFKKRLRTLREFSETENLPLLADKDYPLEEFLQNALNEPESRCFFCYRLRMRQTAEFACNNGFSSFSSTLLGSPYQKHEAIVKAAEDAALEFAVSFYYHDFRPGFYDGVEKSKQRQMYRQSYCGCVFSERDRYQKKKK
jgi:predicted adenine nucleotide alpha hydrolase (AANH) superfamily ATPase